EDTKKFIASLQQYQTMPFQIDQNESSEASLEEKIADGAEFVKENYTRADMLKDIENIANEDPEAFAKLGLKFTRSAKNDRIYVQNVIDNGERGIGYSFATDNELAWAIASYSLGI
ncbi:MAG: hypothetical protein LBM09_03080, partial [Candidatus Nomurabacteria bacterium]|nr:hypothetical protein [Candidatus Nomurabacteria bacterium]